MCDEMPYELYKYGGEAMIDRMTELLNRVRDEESTREHE